MGTNVVRKGTNRAAHTARTLRAGQGGTRGAETKVKAPVPARCVGCNKIVPADQDRCAQCKKKRGTPAVTSRMVEEPQTPPASGKRSRIAEDVVTFGAEIARLRDEEHYSWLKIAQTVGREGNGKTISIWADRVYKLYKSTNGEAILPQRAARRTVIGGVVSRGNVSALPWCSEDIDDNDLPKLLEGRSIVWTNSISGSLEEATISHPQPIMRTNKETKKEELVGYTRGPYITFNEDGRCIINFVSREAGFRAVYVDAIVQMN